HPHWEDILANEEQYCLSLQISIEEQQKLGVPNDYIGNTPVYLTHSDSRRSY
ncbi:hypothetical protein BDQ17DRAFT_1225389, partial [Cyathus striatus]